MGLDIFVGPLTRYYSRNWESISQQYARENNIELEDEEEISPESQDGEEYMTDPGEILKVINNWKKFLAVSLKKETGVDLEWVESTDGEYETDQPDWNSFGALVLKAAYHEKKKKFPETFEDEWVDDPVLKSCFKGGKKSRFNQIINSIEFWIPADFDIIFHSIDPAGENYYFGSSIALFAQLKELNKETWKADEDEIREWRGIDGETESFEELAKLGFSILFDLAGFSVEKHLPIKMDY